MEGVLIHFIYCKKRINCIEIIPSST
uniref:Uncharacterized protein n=1 Tax=Lepeophtheirus salmonis TaxID=72036 RepID=A0A0K2UM22_LEPSM